MRAYTKVAARAKIAKLADQFAGDLEQLKKSPRVKEAHVEDNYIKPLFRYLNWNVSNEGLQLGREEFIVQASQRVDRTMRAPDYLLRLPDRANPRVMRKWLFVEAKHPKYDLTKEIQWIRQAYQYAHSTLSETDRPENRVRLAVLTDFEEFRLFDCVDPAPLKSRDPRAFAKHVVPGFEWTHKDYTENFDALWDAFERDNVRDGSLESLRVTKADAAKQRVAPDVQFLNDLESWRLSIARSMYRLDTSMEDAQISAATQLILDRIVFVKMLYDRGIEKDFLSGLLEGVTKSAAKSGDVSLYDACRDVFQSLDRIYNGSIFQRRAELDAARVDTKVLYDILDSLKPDKSVYTFAAMPVEVIGYAYEQFLGKVIKRTGRTIDAELKPEVRRAKGVYYTPRHVVEYIVDHTLGEALKGCGSPEDVRKIKVLDPACGSGSFLIVAYERILRWYRDWLASKIPEWTNKQGRVAPPKPYDEWVAFSNLEGGRRDLRLRPKLKKQVLLDNIFGVDIDEQAVEVTCFSLSMKALEDLDHTNIHADASLFNMRILPDFRANVKCGNSLIDTDVSGRFEERDIEFTRADRTATNAFNWNRSFPSVMESKRPGFDVVIGNPPYDVVEKERGKASWPHWVLTEYVKSDTGAYNSALGGKTNLFRFFMVRSLLLTRTGGHYGMIVPMAILADISCARTRQNLLLSSANLVADCFPQKDNAARRIFRDAKLSTVVLCCERSEGATRETSRVDVRVYPWDSFDDDAQRCSVSVADAALLDPKNIPIPLVDEARWKLCLKLYRHARVKRLGDVPDYEVTRGEINQTNYRSYIVGASGSGKRRMLKGSEVAAFRLQEPKQGEREWFDEASYLEDSGPKSIVKLRRIATQRITGVDEARRLVATVVDPPMYFADSTNSVVSKGDGHSLDYLLGLLNSKLWNWRFRLTSTNNNVGTNELNSMPFRCIDQKDPADKRLYKQVVDAVGTLRKLHSERGSAKGTALTTLDREIEAATDDLDGAVKRLYGLTDPDWDVVLTPYRSVLTDDTDTD